MYLSWRLYLVLRKVCSLHALCLGRSCVQCVALPLRHPPSLQSEAQLCASAIPVSSKHTYTSSSGRVVVHIAYHTLTQRYLRIPTDTRYCTPNPPPPCLPSSTTRCLALCEVCPKTYQHRPSTPELAEPSHLGRNITGICADTMRPGECKKCGRILASFIDPSQAFGPDKIIPPSILANAKGLAILTVFKVGFLGSGRFGSGVVVARLSDGTWYVDPLSKYAACKSAQDWRVSG